MTSSITVCCDSSMVTQEIDVAKMRKVQGGCAIFSTLKVNEEGSICTDTLEVPLVSVSVLKVLFCTFWSK